MPSVTNVLVNRLKPIRASRCQELRSAFPRHQANAPRVYEQLRAETTSNSGTVFSLSEVGKSLGIGHDAVRRALWTLQRAGWVLHHEAEQAGGKAAVWTLQPRGHGRAATFRGWDAIEVIPHPADLRVHLDDAERRQLFLAFHDERGTAALYLHLRNEVTTHGTDYRSVTMAGLAKLFQCKSQTITSRLRRLEHLRLIERDSVNGALSVSYAVCVDDAPVDDVELIEWLNDPALQPPPEPNLDDLLGRKTIKAQSQLILDFFEMATRAHGEDSQAGMAAGGLKTQNERVARHLAKTSKFSDLQVPLLFFVFEWRGEPVDTYGRTLTTFQRNLPAILEEVDDCLAGDPMYAVRLMKRYGLDASFPIPEIRGDRYAAIRAEKAARSKARIAAEYGHAEVDHSPNVREPAEIVKRPKRARRQRTKLQPVHSHWPMAN